MKLAELQDVELQEFKARSDDHSRSDDGESAEENDDAGDNNGGIVLGFADQGDVGKAPKRPPQFEDSGVRLPDKGTRLNPQTRNFQNLKNCFKQTPPVDTPADNSASSSVFPTPRDLEV